MDYEKEKKPVLLNVLTNKFVIGGGAVLLGDRMLKGLSNMKVSVIDLLPQLYVDFMGINIGRFMSLCVNGMTIAIILGNVAKAIIEVRKNPQDMTYIIVREVVSAVLVFGGLYILVGIGNALIGSAMAFNPYIR